MSGDEYGDESFEAISPDRNDKLESHTVENDDEYLADTDSFYTESPAQKQQGLSVKPSCSSSSSPNTKSLHTAQRSVQDYDNDDFDADEENDDFGDGDPATDEFNVPVKLKSKKSKIKKLKAKKTKAQNHQQCPPAPPRSEAENERLVDDLLDEYNLYPKSLQSRSTKEKPQQLKVLPNEQTRRDDNADNSAHVPPKKRGGGDERALRKEQCQQQTKRLQPTRNSIAPVLKTAVKPKAEDTRDIEDWSAPDSSALQHRIIVLEEREKALIEAVEELSNQNEELIKKLKYSMRNELQLELR